MQNIWCQRAYSLGVTADGVNAIELTLSRGMVNWRHGGSGGSWIYPPRSKSPP